MSEEMCNNFAVLPTLMVCWLCEYWHHLESGDQSGGAVGIAKSWKPGLGTAGMAEHARCC